jgi:protein SCO1/2
MPFKPADPAILPTLKPGDRVEGTLRVEMQDGAVTDHVLADLKVSEPAKSAAEPAKAAPLVLDVSKGKVQLRQQPPRLEVGEPVPDFAMTGQDGRSVRLSDLRGKVVVLTFIYTRCPMPDFCPYMDRRFSELAQHLSSFPNRAKDIRLISVSFDPEHDTPAVLREHAKIRGAVPPLWSYAVASHEELGKVAAPLGWSSGPVGPRSPTISVRRSWTVRANWPAWRWGRRPTSGRPPTYSRPFTPCSPGAPSERIHTRR